MINKPTPEYAVNLLSYLPSRPDYDTWLKVISAVGNEFEERTALDILLSRFSDEKPNETLNKIKSRLNNVSFGTLVFIAKQYGYEGFGSGYNYQNNRTRVIPKPRPVFIDYIQKNCFHNPKEKFQMFDKLKLPVAINTKVINKNISIDTGEVDNFNYLTKYFTNVYLTKDQLIRHISSGHPVIFGHFKQNWNEDFIKSIKKENWLYSKMFALDIEDSISLEEAFEIDNTMKSLFIYTTPSHTEANHRFRIVFDMKGILNDAEQYSYVVKKYIDKYNADIACSNVNRAFYGNDDAIVYVYDNHAGTFTNYLEADNG